ncbi:MAG: ABC transporter permease [Verrucomicrobiales bacterium]|nr:ABC transporter permease [Verrucomicrobiales bacterium]
MSRLAAFSGPGRWLSEMVRKNYYLAAISVECLFSAFRSKSWAQPVRQRLVRQILFGGVEAIPFTVFSGAIFGVVLAINSFKWLEFTGRIDFLGPALSLLLIREAAPFFSSVIIIAASASAITTEMATMRVKGEIDLIESQGINLIQFLVMPRAVGLAIAGVGLATSFVASAFLASAVGIAWIGSIPPGPFFDSIFSSLGLADFVNLIGRSAITAFLMGGICCFEGLSVRGSSTVVPQAVTRGMLRSIAATLVISAIFGILTYM